MWAPMGKALKLNAVLAQDVEQAPQQQQQQQQHTVMPPDAQQHALQQHWAPVFSETPNQEEQIDQFFAQNVASLTTAMCQPPQCAR